MAGRQGFEPRSGGPEPPVLPLDDLPALSAILENWMAGFKFKGVACSALKEENFKGGTRIYSYRNKRTAATSNINE